MSASVRQGSASIVGASGAILIQSGMLQGVVRNSAGLYTVTMNDGYRLAAATCLRAGAIGTTADTVTSAITRVSQTVFTVFLIANDGVAPAAVDANWVLTMTGVQFG